MLKRHSVIGNGGIRLHAVETGTETAPSILFVHGWSQSHLCWSRQLESPLAGRFRLVAFDLRGHGDSDKPADGYDSGAIWAEDLQAVITALDLRRPLLVGWSYAGLILNDYVRMYGDANIAGLCYVGAATDLGIQTSYDFLGSSWNGLLPERPDSVRGTVFSDDAEDVAGAMRLFLRGCFAAPIDPGDEATMLGFNLQCPSRVRAALLSRVVSNDDVLARLRAPALVIHGEADEVVRLAAGRHIASAINGARLSVYGGIGHAPFWEATGRFNDELAAFASALATEREMAPLRPPATRGL